ncbi:tetratricopeptide repeat protein [Thiorhodococcus minor]|uniref:Tetratricopeptide repeat protein n=1 Tax=Thiorhodococcus minor TaxID=57489 RepID=A0A6M0K215_9GAMM|nr:tetratricopeptide repeat protein [Thiorhodococcus minor]NEV63391.1 tetratricopeptide repeat protein [Thiorhodococcus minor]
MRLLFVLLMLIAIPVSAADVGDLVREGEAKLQAGEIDAAAVILERAVELDADSALARTRLGGALLLKQDQPAAIARFRQAIALDARNADAFVGMAVAELHLGRYSLARAALEEAKAIAPKKAGEVDSVIAWIDARTAQAAGD